MINYFIVFFFSDFGKANKKLLFDINDDLHQCLTLDNSMTMGTFPVCFDI